MLGIYKERLQKVIRVDQMIVSHEELAKEFSELSTRSTQHNIMVTELRSQLKLITDELQSLEIDKNQLKLNFDEKQKRKMEILENINGIRVRHEELEKRMKLKSLESKN